VSALLQRELRRLAPYGLGTAGLILSCIPLERLGRDDLAWPSFLLWALVGPAILGVATVAPDSSSGGAAFLVRLPLSPGRVLLGKHLAALSWFAVVLGATLASFCWLVPARERPTIGSFLFGLQASALGIGCLASAISPRVLPAVLLAPNLGLACLLVLLGGPMVAWAVPPGDGLAQAVFPLLGLLALLAASVAYLRGEPHRPSARPALLAGLVMGPALAAGMGATGVAHAWTVEAMVPELSVGPGLGVAAPDHALVAVGLHGEGWTGREERVALVAAPMVLAGREATVVLPQRGVARPEFSPDARLLLLRATRDPGGWLVDLYTARAERLPGLAPEGFGFPWIVWRAGRPLGVRQQGDTLELFLPDPAAAGLEPAALEPWLIRAPLDGRALVGTLLDGRVVLGDAQGLLAVDPPVPDPSLGPGQVGSLAGAGTRLCTWAGASQSQAISPRGSAALRVPAGEPGVLEVYASGTGGRRITGLASALPRLDREQLGWSPDEGYAALRLTGGRVVVLDLHRAAAVELGAASDGFVSPGATGPAVWSSGSDAWVALPSGELLDLRTRRRTRLPVPVAAGLGDERFVPWGLPLRKLPEGGDRLEGGVR
jgi:hypothetical protein